jgi:hypothetical protein
LPASGPGKVRRASRTGLVIEQIARFGVHLVRKPVHDLEVAGILLLSDKAREVAANGPVNELGPARGRSDMCVDRLENEGRKPEFNATQDLNTNSQSLGFLLEANGAFRH